ncbi:hypothetical protein ACRE_065530 [Hapsidospora chrysogenum ATCC 11550]|uniref:Uncharacterized protein n=1 Tax=Hapsidospora chrysogenum (strain ATCC 11550 / CBS 779.69 / DSM 880 / IAM 14645 / JCM 23072 / IMI 49137) TaxID=857340 RepID=A0A086T019_HAPC1|nr:hypothetical protein ACRE_065530 [Hapsidospora chrysogenum ATCC 11550]
MRCVTKACRTLGIDPVASGAELMTIYKWDRLTIFVFKVPYDGYDWATAHHKVDLPVILVDYGKRLSLVKLCGQEFCDEVNQFVARQHELHGWDAKPPYLQDHTLPGVVPTYPNPRCVRTSMRNMGDPEPEPVVRVDKQPITLPFVPAYVCTPSWLGKPAEKATLSEAKLMLTDFGTAAFSPTYETLDSNRASAASSGRCLASDHSSTCSIPELDDVTANQWKRFAANGQPADGRQLWAFDQRFKDAIQGPRRRRRKHDTMGERDSKAFCDMIKDMLKFRPVPKADTTHVIYT